MADSTSTNVSDFNPTIKPYINDLLKQGQALTDVSQRPYQYYGNLTPEQQGKFLTGAEQRTAQFTPMQLQAFQDAQNMTANPISQQAGLGALTAGQNYFGAATNPYAVASLMNPYQQGVTDIAKREAIRQDDIARQGRSAAAVKSGAFGGSRQAIEEAEAARNLNTKLSDLQTQGGQQAYNQAMQALGQGTQYGLQGAATAGTIGQNLFQQGLGINALQAGYGSTQQQQTQGILDKAYQDYLTQQQYPYQQLSYMSDLLRGPASGMTSVSGSSYTPGASTGQQLLGLGATALGAAGQTGGFGNLFSGIGTLFSAEGGQVKSYAEGGTVKGYAEGGMPSVDKLSAMVGQMSDQQLQLALQSAKDAVTVAVIQGTIQKRAQARQAAELQQGALKANAPTVKEQVMQGIASAELPEEMYNDTAMARGGIVAFSGGGDRGEYRDDTGAYDAINLGSYDKDVDLRQDVVEGQAYSPGLMGMLFGYNTVKPEAPKKIVPANSSPDSVGGGRGTFTAEQYADTERTSTAPTSTAPARASAPQAAGTGIASGIGIPKSIKQAVAQTVPVVMGRTPEEHDALVNKKTEQLDSISSKLFQDMNADIDKREGALSDKAKQNVYMGLMQFGIRLLSNKQVDIGEAGSAAFGDYAKAQVADAAAKAAMADKRMALQKYEIETKKGNVDAAQKWAMEADKYALDAKHLEITAKHYQDQIDVERERNQVTREGHAVQNRATAEARQDRLEGQREARELKGKQAFLAEVDKVANSIQNNAKAQMLEITPEDSERQAMAIVAGRMKKAGITMPGMDLSGIQSQAKTAYPGFKEIK
jgi:hypothetical protein